jgi:aldehyde dehydrogenase (NAD+)
VPNNRYDEAVEIAKAAFEGVLFGDPTDPGNFQGPLVSRKQQQRVLGYIEKGRAEGARVVTGGGVPAHLPRGWYVEPTLFAGVDNSMTIAREEIFGPVLSVIGYDGDDGRCASQRFQYGLSMIAGDLDRAKAVAHASAPAR